MSKWISTTFQDVLESGRPVYYLRSGASSAGMRNSPNEEVLKVIAQGNQYDRPDEPGLLKLVKKNKIVLLKNTEFSASNGLVMGKQLLWSAFQSYVVPLDFRWKEEMAQICLGLVAGGIPNKLVLDNARRGDAWMAREFAHLEEDSLVILTLDHFVAPFGVLLIGLCIGIICCITELICYTLSKNCFVKSSKPKDNEYM